MGSLYCPISSLPEAFSVKSIKVWLTLFVPEVDIINHLWSCWCWPWEVRRECPKLSEDVIQTTECRNIGSKRMFRVTCSFSLKSLSHSSAITSFLLRYPDLVSPRTFSVKKFHRISWNRYLIGREYRQENYPEMWNLGSACRAMSAARVINTILGHYLKISIFTLPSFI